MPGQPPEPVARVAGFLADARAEARLEEFGAGTPTAVAAADAVGCQFFGLGCHLLDRLAGIGAAHVRDRTKTAKPVAAFGDFQVSQVSERKPPPAEIRQRIARGRKEHGPLLVLAAVQAV